MPNRKSSGLGRINEFTIQAWVRRAGLPGPFTPDFRPNGEGLQIVEHELWWDGKPIARWSSHAKQYLYVTLAGYTGKRVRTILNQLPNVWVEDRDGSIMLNGKAWTGDWVYLHPPTSGTSWRYGE
jgi:hypothetical protein